MRVASVGARGEDAVAPAEGAGPAARRRREGPPRSLGSTLWFPSCLPAPTARLASGRARGAGNATQSFQRHFQRVGREPLHGGARTEGTKH